ncbi:MAG: AAA family ATPase [Lachnospiraceae bacterium]|nr:AAA family ATPase [Lachnospiraceae bacterium]
MKYISIADAAKELNITSRRLQQMCASGEIRGARKEGRRWVVPDSVIEKAAVSKRPLPIGISDYKIATSDYYYVDKTMLIRDFLDKKPMVSLFMRPRRFGKTLNMDMLRVFFEKTDEDTSKYFRDKAIWSCGKEYTGYQGQYPVIFLSFKDIKCADWQETHEMITRLISAEFRRHPELENSDRLSDYEKSQYSDLSRGKADSTEYQLSLKTLSLLLHKHYGKEAIIIIDEYDTPIQQGHTDGFYKEVIEFMRNLFSGGLKDNSHLAYGFLTGILRVAKESIFSGLNNLTVNSILDEQYSTYFGFTKEEVCRMLEYYGCGDKFDEVCEWYDGYMFGSTEIFNPWSVINYVSENCFAKAFWQSTGSNDIIGEIVGAANDEITENLYKLLSGGTVTSYIDTGVIYPEVQNNPYSIYSFLLVAGYLKVVKVYPQHDGNYMCDVAIPNKEIAFVYGKEVLNKTGKTNAAISIQQALFSNDAGKLQELLEKFMISSISAFDGTGESFYHGMMLGLCAVLNNRYRIRSNSESGYGRFDIALIPINKSDPGFIFEFKYAGKDSYNLEALADKALAQIEEKKYETELHSQGVTKIIKTGIAFKGKKAVVRQK